MEWVKSASDEHMWEWRGQVIPSAETYWTLRAFPSVLAVDKSGPYWWWVSMSLYEHFVGNSDLSPAVAWDRRAYWQVSSGALEQELQMWAEGQILTPMGMLARELKR